MGNASKYSQRKARQHLRAAKKRPKGQVKADINVTPLVDVVLVLLIIFMVVTPMITSGVQVNLPKTAHHGKKPDDGKDIIVSVTVNKDVYVSRKRVPLKEVSRAVEEEVRRFPEKGIYLKGDARAPYGAVRSVMEAVNKIGVEDIMLGTDEIKSAPAAH